LFPRKPKQGLDKRSSKLVDEDWLGKLAAVPPKKDTNSLQYSNQIMANSPLVYPFLSDYSDFTNGKLQNDVSFNQL